MSAPPFTGSRAPKNPRHHSAAHVEGGGEELCGQKLLEVVGVDVVLNGLGLMALANDNQTETRATHSPQTR